VERIISTDSGKRKSNHVLQIKSEVLLLYNCVIMSWNLFLISKSLFYIALVECYKDALDTEEFDKSISKLFKLSFVVSFIKNSFLFYKTINNKTVGICHFFGLHNCIKSLNFRRVVSVHWFFICIVGLRLKERIWEKPQKVFYHFYH